MRLRSFRVRIALSLVLLTGSALMGFGAISWWLIRNAQISRLDEVAKTQLQRLARSQQRDRWQLVEDLLPRLFGVKEKIPVAFLIRQQTNKAVLYQSRDWPTDLNIDGLLPPAPSQPAPPAPTVSASPKLGPKVPLSAPRFTTRQTVTDTWRIGTISSAQSQVAIAISLQAVDTEMAAIRNAFLLSIALILLLVAAVAWGLSGRALSPIRQLTQAMDGITVEGLDQRVPVGGADQEFAALIQVFNQMLENLDRSFHQASRFSADAAHELKTPLAILQGELEHALHQAEAGSELQQRLSSLLDEVRRLSSIVRKLLLLSLVDAGRINLYRVSVDVSDLLVQLLEDIELLNPVLAVESNIEANLRIQGDRDLVAQVLQNLISNAVKYNLPDGWITLSARRSGSQIRITVSNASKNMAAAERDRIFDRFYRGDPARTRNIEGTGLGLSLSREIVRAHSGDLTLDPTPPGQIALTLSFPSEEVSPKVNEPVSAHRLVLTD
ncbi:MAG: ATP-binding protein [Thermosynechococcaceae cyanobacterium MS004]|nr:ATP-binding protein [Thermosynechococcaceae cyanobacterium MS004]